MPQESLSRTVSVESVAALENTGLEQDRPPTTASVVAVEAFDDEVSDYFHGNVEPFSCESDALETFTVHDLRSHFKRLGADLQESLRAHLQDVLRTEMSALMKDLPPRGPRQQAVEGLKRDAGFDSDGGKSLNRGTPNQRAPLFTNIVTDFTDFSEYADEDTPLLHRGYLARKVYDSMAPMQGLEVSLDDGFHTNQQAATRRRSQRDLNLKTAKSFPVMSPTHSNRLSHQTSPEKSPQCEPPPEEEIPVMELDPLRLAGRSTALGLSSEHSGSVFLPEKSSAPNKEAWGSSISSRQLLRASAKISTIEDETGGQKVDLRAARANANVHRTQPLKMRSMNVSTLFQDKTCTEAFSAIFRKVGLYIVEKTYFNIVAGIAIVFYCVAIAIQTQWLAKNLDEDPPAVFFVTEIIFCVFFALELMIRLAAYQMYFFYGDGYLWNWLDTFLVATQVVDLMLGAILDNASERTTNISFIRILRVLRLVRVIRLVRLVRLMSELRSMLGSIMTSIKSLFFTLVLVFFLVFIMGIFLTQLVVEYIRSNDDSRVEHDLRHFATLESSFLVLFQSLTGGVDWGEPLQPLIEHISPLVGITYCLYISFGVLCMLNVITGVFVESACNSTQEEKDANMVSRLQQFLCNNMDSSFITWEEFSSRLDDPEIQMYFKSIDLDLSEAQGLFKLLDSDDSGTVEAEEFVLGCLRLRGVAKAVDLATLMYENRRWHKRTDRLTRRIDQVLHTFSAQLSSLCLS